MSRPGSATGPLRGILKNVSFKNQSLTPRCFFCNKSGHAFTDCAWWKGWVQEDPGNKYLGVKCHRGRRKR